MPLAARITDMYVCPMVSTSVVPVPHVGGPIIGPGVSTVLIGNLPAATVTDICACIGPPATVITGSATVFIGGRPAARVGDTSSHGGTIIMGWPSVIIGG